MKNLKQTKVHKVRANNLVWTALIVSLIVSIASVDTVYASSTTLHVDPLSIVDPALEPGTSFTINVSIADIIDLYGFDFHLSYTGTTVLNVTEVVEGPFLKEHAALYGGDTFIGKLEIDNVAGYVWFAVAMYGVPKGEGASGNGTLATISFLVTGVNDTALGLYDTKLSDSYGKPIAHDVVDGYFNNLIHNVAIIGVTASPTKASPGQPISINVTVENQGDYTETFNVSVYYTRISDPLIGTQNVTLVASANTTLTFEWTPNMTGRYEILANTTEISGDIDPSDNTYTTIVYVGYDGSNPGSHNGESVTGLSMASFIFAMFASVIVLAFRKNREMSLSDMPASILKQNLRNNLPNNTTNMWQDHIKRQPI